MAWKLAVIINGDDQQQQVGATKSHAYSNDDMNDGGTHLGAEDLFSGDIAGMDGFFGIDLLSESIKKYSGRIDECNLQKPS